MSTLSVIIPAYDQHKITALHVQELMKSTRLPEEVIVVNDGGKDNLKGMLKKIDKKCPVYYAKINEDIAWNYTGARNLGFWLSDGDYVCLEDTDHIPMPDVYERAVKYLDENKEVDKVVFHTRKKVYKDDALTNPVEKWKIIDPPRGTHYDLHMMRRELYLKVKGFDERFSGKYAWACTDWRRRTARVDCKHEKVYVNYYVILNAETQTLERRRSKENYSLAKQGGDREHIQSPKGILNFTYTYEELK